MTIYRKVLGAGLFLSPVTFVFSAEPTLVWAETYNNGGDDAAYGIALDGQGSVYVAGSSEGPNDGDVRLVKYNTDGSVVWSRSYDRGNEDAALAVAVDSEGNIYLTGVSHSGTSNDCLIMKYTSLGDTVWTRIAAAGLPSPSVTDEGAGIAVDNDYVYVTGYYYETLNEDVIRTLIYDKDGGFIKVKTFDTPDEDQALDIALDGQGNVYVAGFSGHDYRIIKYTNELDELWNIPYDAGDIDRGAGIAVDQDGLVFVSGTKGEEIYSTNFCTVCFDGSGGFRWSKPYDSGKGDLGYRIAVDEKYVYVAGGYVDTLDTISGFRTICYDKEGNLVWSTLYPDTGAITFALDVAVDGEGSVYVTGMKNIADPDMLTLKYATNVGVSERPQESPLSLEVLEAVGPRVTLRYSLPSSSSATLSFYSADGRRIESFTLDASQSTFTWDTRNTRNTRNTPSGVYFARLESGTQSAATKFVLVR